MANLITLWAFILSFLPPAGTPTSSAPQSYQVPITLATCSVQLYGVGVGFTSGLRQYRPQAPIHKTAPGHFLVNPDDARNSSGSQFMFKISLHSELLFALSSSNRVYSELLIATYHGLWRKAQNSQSPWVLASYLCFQPLPPLARFLPATSLRPVPRCDYVFLWTPAGQSVRRICIFSSRPADTEGSLALSLLPPMPQSRVPRIFKYLDSPI